MTTHRRLPFWFAAKRRSRILFEVRGLDIAAEIAAIDFRDLAFSADYASFHSSAIASRSLWNRTKALL